MKKLVIGFVLVAFLLAFGQTVNTPTLQRNNQWTGLNQFLGGNYVAKADATATANIAGTLLYAVPANGGGMYRFTAYLVLTQAAATSSTLPLTCSNWTDLDTSTSPINDCVGTSPTTNTVGTVGFGGSGQANILNLKGGTNLLWFTSNYASNPANTMQYTVHIKLEYLGN